MVALDTNILVAAHRKEISYHRSALEKLTFLTEGADFWVLPVFCIGEFLRVVTHPKLFNPPSKMSQAIEAIHQILKSPSVRVLYPETRYWKLLSEACTEGGARGNLVFDAQIVALLREHGIDTIISQDRDFLRFPKIRLQTL